MSSLWPQIEPLLSRVQKPADDIRPSIRALRHVGPTLCGFEQGYVLETELAAKPQSIRPSELLLALAATGSADHVVAPTEERDVCRLHQWILRDGARVEPLLGGDCHAATDAPHAFERAS